MPDTGYEKRYARREVWVDCLCGLTGGIAWLAFIIIIAVLFWM